MGNKAYHLHKRPFLAIAICLTALLLQIDFAYAAHIPQKEAASSTKAIVLNELYSAHQQKKITITLSNASLAEAFNQIARKAEVGISYEPSELPDKKITYHCENKDLFKVLNHLLAGTLLTYHLSEDREAIIIKRKPQVQTGTITGMIYDAETGNPMPGASVFIEGTTKGDDTDTEGNYTITGVEPGTYTLIARFLGYNEGKKEVTVNADEAVTVNFELISKASELEELVVVGYGTVRKRDLTGAIASVTSEEIAAFSPTSFAEALAGRATGVMVKQSNGRPGKGIKINIRGITSITGSNEPLYVIDGVTITPYSMTGSNTAVQSNILASIDPDDIESIQILKGASAAAIYGSRAAGGVVIVTTKQGQKGMEPQITAGYSVTTSQILDTYNILNAVEYKEVMTTAAKNSNMTGGLKAEILNNPDFFGNANTNWQDEITRTAISHNWDIGVYGGTDKTTYSFSAGISDQSGMILRSEYSRYAVHTTLESDATDFLTLGTTINYMYSDRQQSTFLFAMANAISFRPDLPIRDSSGELFRYNGGPNPVASLQREQKTISQNLLGNVFARVNFRENLSLTSKLNLGLFNGENHTFSPLEVLSLGQEARLSHRNARTVTTTFDNTLKYANTLGQYHNVDALIGTSWYKARNSYSSLSVQGFANYKYINNISAGNEITGVDGVNSVTGMASYFGRLNYNYNQKYYATFTLRTDGSSKFGPNNKWAVFPSGAVAWNISSEPFMDSINWVNNLKVRTSYGKTGLSNVPDFLYKVFFDPGEIYNNVNGLAPTGLPNPSIGWQTSWQFDLALDFSLFDSRLNGTFGYFSENIKGLLLERPVVPETGTSSQNANVGNMENHGIEFSIDADIIRQENFLLQSMFNITAIHNEITNLTGSSYGTGAGSSDAVKEGYPLGTITGYKVAGIFRNQDEIDQLNSAAPDGLYQNVGTAPGDFKFKDINNDGQITAADQVVLGDIQPDFYGGWTTNVKYKGFELSTLVQFVHGYSKIWEMGRFYGFVNRTGNVLQHFIDDAWSPSNPDGTDPRIVLYDPNNNARRSDAIVHDASYIRLKNVRLGYTLPASFTNQLQIDRVELYTSVSNLLTITDYPGLDPETSRGIRGFTLETRYDIDEYPLSRSVVFGIDIQF